MAYGRLDIFFPDGMFRTFLLANSPVSIGRSTGNTIPLDTDTISRYHLTLTHDDGQVTITDLESANGTFVEGERLKNNEPRPLFGGEEILIGELRIIFHNLDDNPTRPTPALFDEQVTQQIAREDVGFVVEAENPPQAIPPGAHISATLIITNKSDKNERYSIEIGTMPKGWTRIDRPEVEIAAGDKTEVLVSFKPIRRYDSAPGEYTAQVTVRPASKPDAALICPIRLRVLPFSGFGVALAKRTLETDGRFRLYVQNQGSAPLPIALMGRDTSNHLRFNFPMNAMTLAPGQRAAVDGRVRPRQSGLFGEPRQSPFDLIVRSTDSAGFLVAVRGYLTEKPPLPAWAGFAIGGIVLSLLALLVVALLILLRPNTTPVIAAFTLSAERVAQGTPLELIWDVENTEQIGITVNGVSAPVTVNERRSGALLDTSALIGQIQVALIAFNGSNQTSAIQEAFVFTPLAVANFEVEPPRLVRFVAQTIAVRWSVVGAVSTRLSGVEGWSSTPLESAYAAEATISIAGIPVAPVELVLSAESIDGEQISQTYAIPVIDPECSALADNTPLYVGTDIRHQVIGSASPGVALVVDAQNLDGTWLRFLLSGGIQGWGQRSAFTCADTFNPDDLRKEANVPPTPTSPPTLTPIPTLAPTVPTATPRPGQTRTTPPGSASPTPTTAG
jgi:hypothetical protein